MELFELSEDGDKSHAESYSTLDVASEYELHTWLQQNPSLLGEQLLILGRESDFKKGRIDLLALDRYGNTVVIEVKQGDTATGSTSEDKILGQPQRYATSVESLEYEDLQEEYSRYLRDWETESVEGDLATRFEQKFGQEPSIYNHYQRMVLVAEDITSSTIETAQYLVGEGLKLQCREVRQFVSPDESSVVLGGTTVVNYNLSDVRPPSHDNDAYYGEALDMVEETLFDTRDVLKAEMVDDVLTEYGSTPGIESNHPEHPESVVYRTYIRPADWTWVGIGISVYDEDHLREIRENKDLFEQHGFSMNMENTRDRIVAEGREMDDSDRAELDAYLEELATKYTELVRLGHEIFTSSSSS